MTTDKELKDYFDWLTDEKQNLWIIEEAFDNKKGFELIKEILGEKQARFFKSLIKRVMYALFEWHDKEDTDGSHKDIRSQLKKMDARLRNHRHETSRTFCGKAEY